MIQIEQKEENELCRILKKKGITAEVRKSAYDDSIKTAIKIKDKQARRPKQRLKKIT